MGFTYKNNKSAGEFASAPNPPAPGAVCDYNQRLRQVMHDNANFSTRGDAAQYMATNYPALYADYCQASGRTR